MSAVSGSRGLTFVTLSPACRDSPETDLIVNTRWILGAFAGACNQWVESGTRILRVIHGREARATSATGGYGPLGKQTADWTVCGTGQISSI